MILERGSRVSLRTTPTRVIRGDSLEGIEMATEADPGSTPAAAAVETPLESQVRCTVGTVSNSSRKLLDSSVRRLLGGTSPVVTATV